MNTTQKRNTKRLIAALRSGKYEKTTRVLKRGNTPDMECFCVQGVACDISGIGTWDNNSYVTKTPNGDRHYASFAMPKVVLDYYGLDHKDADTLLDLNDNGGYTFEDLADCLDYILRSES